MRKKYTILGIVLSVLVVIFAIMYGFIYATPTWTEWIGYLSAVVIFSTIILTEWCFIKAGLVPKVLKYFLYFRWGGTIFVLLITTIYLVDTMIK